MCLLFTTDYCQTLGFAGGLDDISRQISGILKPTSIVHETVVHGGIVLDIELLNRVFKAPITTIKSIHHGWHMAFSQAL